MKLAVKEKITERLIKVVDLLSMVNPTLNHVKQTGTSVAPCICARKCAVLA
jgi:hypothetical protein